MATCKWNEAVAGFPPEEQAEIMALAGYKKVKSQEVSSKQMVKPTIVNLATVDPEEVTFLWDPYIPMGKLTLLEGDPGLGKTFLALNLCTAISQGWPLPGPDGRPGEKLEPGNILFMTAEDGLADTLAPRLEKMSADRNRIYCLTGWRTPEGDEEQAFTLRDVNVLRAALDQVKPVLVVIDPLQAYIGGIDMHRANETRPLLSSLACTAEEYNCAVLAIRHLSKGGSTKALYRGLGSIDFTAAARSVLLVGQDPNNGNKAMVHTKSSCTETGITQGFEITNTNGFMWTGQSNCTAEDLLSPPGPKEDESKDSALDEAKEYLLDALRDEPIKAEILLKKGPKETGVSARTFKRAKKELEIESRKKADGWYWYLPLDLRVPEKELGTLGTLDTSLTEPGVPERVPRVPNEKCETLEQDKFDSWLQYGTEVKGG